MNEVRKKLIGLLHYPETSWLQIGRLIKNELPSDLIETIPRLADFPLFSKGQADKNPISHSLQKDILSERLHEYKVNKISIITILDPEYPEILKQIYQPPWALFAKGDVSILANEPKLAVVGSREATQYGKNAIRLLFPGLLERGIVIVSGLAKGIDACAHECAIRNAGRTIAVIAGGLYHIYPEENRKLANQMFKSQLVLSEYPPDTKPSRWQFPMRNRIISGLSRGTIIIEAKRKSGSLITANYAVNEGREVFSLPGSIFNPLSGGANELIQQGAKLVTTAEDIIEELRLI
ncbi:DNA protecting protein DprA [Bacillus sp. FJAT-27225]|uniref:DNA-processing protein DprA n=1 Tax=Bacillus sp. FJAT-27225 TaxID=1743144 RepID=UPI00080C2352|nr:DNA-processing protein DprA [Bacillus sp. FJAT-27225]OCA85454.1 DNA protecting protein DprA [Bacillus sp. FJAT-27225]